VEVCQNYELGVEINVFTPIFSCTKRADSSYEENYVNKCRFVAL